ncbi:hypothetical protein PMAYCL1PPCAC_21123, partial [Pristionchus mayeri]
LFQMAEKFIGRFVNHTEENLEEYFKEMGMPFIVRKIALNARVTLDNKIKGNKWICAQETLLLTVKQEFELDKEVEETHPDGRKFMTTYTLTSDGKLVSTQRKIKESDKTSTATRYFEGDDTMVVVMECGGVKAKRYFKRIK